jgi:MYXO-CTERM domain-containing protein
MKIAMKTYSHSFLNGATALGLVLMAMTPSQAMAVATGNLCAPNSLLTTQAGNCSDKGRVCVAEQCMPEGLLMIVATFRHADNTPSSVSNIDLKIQNVDKPTATDEAKLFRNECYRADTCDASLAPFPSEVYRWESYPVAGEYYAWVEDEDARGGRCDKPLPAPYLDDKINCENGNVFADMTPGNWLPANYMTALQVFYDGAALDGTTHTLELVCLDGWSGDPSSPTGCTAGVGGAHGQFVTWLNPNDEDAARGPLWKLTLGDPPKCDLNKPSGHEDRKDTDGDGLCDRWERSKGIDWDCHQNWDPDAGTGGHDESLCDGIIDLELPGADYQRKDVYVEMDYLAGGSSSSTPYPHKCDTDVAWQQCVASNCLGWNDATVYPGNATSPVGCEAVDEASTPNRSKPNAASLAMIERAFADAPVDCDAMGNNCRGIKFHAIVDDAITQINGTAVPADGVMGFGATSDTQPTAKLFPTEIPMIQWGTNTPTRTSTSCGNNGWFGTSEERSLPMAECEKAINARFASHSYILYGYGAHNGWCDLGSGPEEMVKLHWVDVVNARFVCETAGGTYTEPAHGTDYEGFGGIAELPGNNMLVLHGRDREGGGYHDQAYTIMHEFGHSIGMHHGGPALPGTIATQAKWWDDATKKFPLYGDYTSACKPNYFSIMNYLNMPEANPNQPLDFSRSKVADFVESSINESNGVDQGAAASTMAAPSTEGWTCVRHADAAGGTGTRNCSLGAGIDYDSSGSLTGAVSFDVSHFNEFGSHCDPGVSTLEGREDWNNLVLDFLVCINPDTGNPMPCGFSTAKRMSPGSPARIDEPTPRERDELAMSLDTDEDGVNDFDDNCVELFNPEQEDADGDRYGDVCDICPDVYAATMPHGCPFGDASDEDVAELEALRQEERTQRDERRADDLIENGPADMSPDTAETDMGADANDPDDSYSGQMPQLTLEDKGCSVASGAGKKDSSGLLLIGGFFLFGLLRRRSEF